MKCPRCEHGNPAAHKFCSECGTPLRRAPGSAELAPSYADLQRSLTESLEQQTATSEILRVISQSPTDIQPVLDTVTATAAAVCGATDALIMRVEGHGLRRVAHFGPIPLVLPTLRPLTRDSAAGRAILECQTIHIHDILAADAARDYPEALPAEAGPMWRTMLAVPLLREGAAIGAILIRRTETRPFTAKEIFLLETFASQAVIAIENVRLFKELSEALEQQTATSEILGVISSSPTDVQPVFDSLVASAARLCRANDVLLLIREGDVLRPVAGVGAFWASLAADFRVALVRGSVAARSVIDGTTLHIPDLAVVPEVEFPLGRDLQRRFRHHTTLAVPLLRDGIALGTIFAMRFEVRPFADQQIALLKTFADQAVIAIENVRLFNELEGRNGDLTRTLAQQTATAEILRVIAASPTDEQPVFDAIVRSAQRLLRGHSSTIRRLVDDQLVAVAFTTTTLEGDLVGEPRRAYPAARSAMAVLEGQPWIVTDVLADPQMPAEAMEQARARGYRSVLGVPLVRGRNVIGILNVSRRETGGFTDKEVALLQTFADQAVIAIENVRLFRELEAANRDLQAASQHKSEFLANMSHELRTPLNAVIGFSEVLSERMFGDLNEKQAEYANDIHASGQHLLSLINDILDLSKIEAGKMELELSDFDLPATIDNALMLVRERAARRGIDLQRTVDDRIGQVQADERKVRQILLNLLSNAMKFTPEGGRIDVHAMPRDGMVEVSVTDTGVGIAPEDQEAVFDEFRQVGTADKKVEGTGLGLALSRRFIELHGGNIWVKSQVGEGSMFTFTIPARHGE